MPTRAVEDPANFTVPGQLGLGVPTGRAGAVVAASSTNGIPSAALAAYQRAETVINAADKACNMDWQLLAAVGRVESDHGRYGGNRIGTDGTSRPGIYGIALDGTNQTMAISDTDAGMYDRDKVWDRAVGPMQFIPSTWSVVGVDADGDGQRDPQNVNDAALAAAAYLCSDEGDLGTEAGRRSAVFRYNHSRSYVDLVLRVRAAYLQGEYHAVPNYIASAITFTPDHGYTPPNREKAGGPRAKSAGGPTAAHSGSGGSISGSGTAGSPSGGSEPTAPSGAGGDTAGGLGGDGDDPVEEITRQVDKAVTDTTDTVTRTSDSVSRTVEPVLSLAEATLKCTAAGYSALLTPADWKTCISTWTS